MGKFVKGQSGNPGGRPREVGDLRELAREYTEVAINALTEITQDTNAPPAARVAASCALLDRGYGKPVQQQTIAAQVDIRSESMIAQADETAERMIQIAMARRRK